ncbi:serum paraoxonase/arylesterase 1-like [Pecten maximus]|uniref:serum paraoxonase/arylesterase 1-like n=1 Tax=Pecten maximus TaxID=6579 RepID=UPI001458E9DD|nr:serum paraoxonase/arylesterase 1-like [Pecten maximus]XP_033741688.1 serum paraoxonase/arylesterase 1-like [Pecten maximus]
MLRRFVLTAVVALVVQQAVRYWFFMDYHKTKTILHHRPGPCRHLEGADGGSEDLTVLDNGMAFISSGYCSWVRGRILLYDFNNSSQKVKELPIVSSSLDQSDLSFHGLSVWQDSATEEITLMVINHATLEDRIEVFRFLKENQTLLHLESITSPKLTDMNDLVMTSNRSFYITKYTTLRDYLRLELLLMLKYGEIFYYDGSDFRSVTGGLHMPNGINVSPDHRFLYVSEYGRKQLKSYRIVGTELEHVEDLFLDTLVDNIEIEPETGDLWVGCHPIHYYLMDYADIGSKSPAPSQILRVKTSDGKFTEAVEVYYDSGYELEASTVASVYKGKMIAGTVVSQLIVCDLVYTD